MNFITGTMTIKFDSRSTKKLTTEIIKEYSNQILKQLKNNKEKILIFIKSIIKQNLENSPEVQSLSSEDGKLRVELGVVDGSGDIGKFIDAIVSKVQIDINKLGTSSQGIDISIIIFINAEYANFYSQTYSSYVTEGGAKVEWLNWLLEAGDTDIVFGYKIKYGVEIGRAGDAIMMPSKSSNWSIPPEFSGVENNNFVTRSFDGIDQELLTFIGGILS